MEDRKLMKSTKAHTLHMENRERVIATGVEDVDSFNDVEINFQTECGYITLTGNDLHISRLNLEDGQLIVEGEINGVAYSGETEERQAGLFSRLFK